MAKVNLSLNLGVPASKLWDTIGGLNALPDWHPAIEKSEVDGQGEGSVRTLTLAGGGGTITERLDNSDAKSHSYTYSILDGPLPVANYQATIKVSEQPDGTSTVEWDSDFQPKGAPEQAAVEAIQGVYQAGFDNLKKMFGG